MLHPAIVLLVDSKLRLCGVFLHAASHWVPGKGNCGRGGCARSTPQPGTYESGIWECEADVAIASRGNLVSGVERAILEL